MKNSASMRCAGLCDQESGGSAAARAVLMLIDIILVR
jgi:hypothetical protein